MINHLYIPRLFINVRSQRLKNPMLIGGKKENIKLPTTAIKKISLKYLYL